MRYHVSPRGDNTKDGLTPATAWRTLAWAVKQPLLPGDEIVLEAGVHPIELYTGENELEVASMYLDQPGAPGNPITIRGDVDGSVFGNPGTAWITDLLPDGSVVPAESVFHVRAPHWVIRDLAIHRLATAESYLASVPPPIDQLVISPEVIRTEADVTLERLSISGGMGAIVHYDGELSISRSVIEGSFSGIVQHGPGIVRVKDVSIDCLEAGVYAADYGDLEVLGCRISADKGIDVRYASSIEIAGADVKAHAAGIRLEHCSAVALNGNRVRSAHVALELDNSSVSVRGSDLSGARAAVWARSSQGVELRNSALHDSPVLVLAEASGVLVHSSSAWRYGRRSTGGSVQFVQTSHEPVDIVGLGLIDADPIAGTQSGKLPVPRVALPQVFTVPVDPGVIEVTGQLRASSPEVQVELTLGDTTRRFSGLTAPTRFAVSYSSPVTGTVPLTIWAETPEFDPDAYVLIDSIAVGGHARETGTLPLDVVIS